MAARRLLIVMLVLLGVSTLAAALAPPPPGDDEATTETEAKAEPPQGAGRLPSGRLLRAEIEIGGRRKPLVPVRLGDQLALLVRSKRPGEVEITKLGLIESVDAFSPARFDILAEEVGTYAVRFADGERVAARVVVRSRAREGRARR